MKKGPANRSSLFLMELIIAILFFSFASAVCVQLFIKSHLLSNETKNLNMAVNQAVSAAESIEKSQTPDKILLSIYPDATVDQDSIFVFYDNNWQTCGKSKSAYYMKVQIVPAVDLVSAEITVLESESESILYELSVAKHIPYVSTQ